MSSINSKWAAVERNGRRLLLETSPKGFAQDWFIWKKGVGWQPDSERPNIGSYNAIRVYLWIGMLAHDAPQASRVSHTLLPITVRY